MTNASNPAFPAAAIEWLAPRTRGRRPLSLVLGRASAPIAAQLAKTDEWLVACDSSRAGLRTLLDRVPHAQPIVARPERLPFVPTTFDSVWVHQSFHTLIANAVLPEFARVLAPGGRLALSYLARDDSVPWVRRLAALIRTVDPSAMSGSYGLDAVDAVANSPFFPEVEHRTFRLWIPIARVGLLHMVASRFPDLAPDRLQELMTEVGNLYEASARVPEPLLLPYQVNCWRATVSHDEFTSPLRIPDDGLTITV